MALAGAPASSSAHHARWGEGAIIMHNPDIGKLHVSGCRYALHELHASQGKAEILQ